MLYNRFAGPLYRYACATLRNEEAAKDVVQDTMIGAWRSAPSFAGRSSVATWIFAICSNKIKDHVRGQSRATAGHRSPAGMSIRGEPAAARTAMNRKAVAGSDSPGICRENTGIMFPFKHFLPGPFRASFELAIRRLRLGKDGHEPSEFGKGRRPPWMKQAGAEPG